MAGRSLGTYVILDHIRIARDAGIPYVYLGYWVPGSAKMTYKANFAAVEIYCDGEWKDLGDPRRYSPDLDRSASEPVAEQVARISLPDTRPVRPEAPRGPTSAARQPGNREAVRPLNGRGGQVSNL